MESDEAVVVEEQVEHEEKVVGAEAPAGEAWQPPLVPQPKDGDPTMKSQGPPPAGSIESGLWMLGGHALTLKSNIEALSAVTPEGPTLVAVRAAAAAADRARRNLIAALGSAAEAGQ